MGRINVLPENIINLIAAGEVVERPASVVKELIENSLDAEATEITVKIKDGGTTSIEISDNGIGMDAQDALLAFTQHATSKITSEADLQNLSTLGFRGEALASIGSVATVTLETKTEGDDAVSVITANSETKQLDSARSKPGTKISITKLFESIPARKKFLRSPGTELSHVQQTFLEAALTNLHVHFELYHNDKLLKLLPATSKFSERVFQIWDEHTAQKLYHSEIDQGDIKMQLYLGSPDIARKDRKQQFIFVNGRPIKDRLIQRAVQDGYRGFIHRDLSPAYFLMLDIEPSLVDVNVHPRKSEVRFQNGQHVFSLVRNTVSSKLDSATKEDLLERISESPQSAIRPPAQVETVTQIQSSARPKSENRPPILNQNSNVQAMSFSQEMLSGPEPMQQSYSSFNEITEVSQLFATYIVYQKGSDVVFVDQHAAAEKILYEKLLESLDTKKSMPLLVPEVLEFNSNEKEAILASESDLAELGLEISDFGGSSIQVTAKPELTPNLEVKQLLLELIAKRDEFGEDSLDIERETATEPAHHLIATMACHGSIRAGQRLSQPEMRQIIKDLELCTRPYNCPHGRPVSWVMSRGELESNFKRVI